MIKLDHVRKTFGSNQALKSTTLTLEKGCYGLLGPNGAGKTTLLRCVAGLLEPNEGRIEVEGRFSYLPQSYSADKNEKVKAVLNYYAVLKDIPLRERREAVREALEAVGLLEQGEQKISALSGGMMRRLGIAQAVLGDPDIILFDEPTAGLDPMERLRFRNIMMQRRRTEALTILSTHIVNDVEAVCERLLIMNRGRIIANTTALELMAAEQTDTLEKAFLYVIQKDDDKRRVL